MLWRHDDLWRQMCEDRYESQGATGGLGAIYTKPDVNLRAELGVYRTGAALEEGVG
jgi:hypothetical protein